MSQILTGGMIAVEDGTKKAEQYDPARKVRVELRFDVAENADPDDVLARVSAMAAHRVDLLLGRAAVPIVRRITDLSEKAVEVVPAAAADPAAMTPEAPKRHRRTKAEMEAAAAAAAVVAEVKAAPAQPFHQAADPSAIEGPAVSGVAASAPEAEVDITDGSLLSTVTAINTKIKKAAEITKIILTYCPADGTPPSLKKIPKEKRAAFLAELKAWAATQKVAE